MLSLAAKYVRVGLTEQKAYGRLGHPQIRLMDCKSSQKRMDGKSEGPPIGIDLGTSYSCVGVWLNNGVEIIPNDQGKRITPSCVAFTCTERFIGDLAENRAAMNPTNTVFGN
ncbi:hypothetical protein L6164_006619 [Bauhinia variegata]|uniref:Uncharacterized protein n=1 Tax=Bauhinia variegata TaxID=167791 RepID=A0ACB9PUZ0_BAUVA|nr:hypothetical protein L6164_006619 [Bauhinia variegata]